MKISIIMSVFNNSKTLKRSIESILNQDYKNFEFLIMNDSSTDSTKEILKNYKNTDARIKIYENNKNLGLTKSLNILINNAKGELIARQDADDYSVNDRFSTQIEFLKNYNLDGCTSRSKVISTGKVRPGLSYFLPIKLAVKYKNPFIHGTLLIKKKVLQDVGNYDENFYYAQDYKLFKDLIDKGYKIKSINKFLYYLNTENNISSNMKKEQNYYAKLVRRS
tara:strand:- start:340 stop:1005 length:666 start_codon:yes stop_codon:yes gene_type:complete